MHTAFCLCHDGINPLRCSLGSQTLQQFMSERLHRLQLLQGFSQTTLALQRLLISFFPSLYVLGFGLESTTWAGFPQRSPSACTTPRHLWDDKLLWVTARDGDTGRSRRAGWQGLLAHGLAGCWQGLIQPSIGRNHFLFRDKYPNPALFRKNYSAFSSLPGLSQSYLRAELLQCLQTLFLSFYGSPPNQP